MKENDFSLLELLDEAAHPPGYDYNKYNKDNFIPLINNKRIVTIYYSGAKEGENSTDPNPGWRTIEPVAIGEGNPPLNGLYLRAWLISGKSISNTKSGKAFRPKPGWRFFKVSRIRNINVGVKTFDQPRPGFNTVGDDQLSTIYAVAKFNNNDAGEDNINKKGPKKPKPTSPYSKDIDDKKEVSVKIDNKMIKIPKSLAKDIVNQTKELNKTPMGKSTKLARLKKYIADIRRKKGLKESMGSLLNDIFKD